MIKKSIFSSLVLLTLVAPIYPIDERLRNEKGIEDLEGIKRGSASEIAEHIKGLENVKYKKELEAVEISSRILKERKTSVAREDVLLGSYWKPNDKENKKESLARFISDLCYAFDGGEDIKPILDKAPLNREGMYNPEVLILRLVIQEIVVCRMTDRFKELVQELAVINKDLRTLRNLSRSE